MIVKILLDLQHTYGISEKKDYMFEYSIRNALRYIFVLNCVHFLFMWLTPTFCYLY